MDKFKNIGKECLDDTVDFLYDSTSRFGKGLKNFTIGTLAYAGAVTYGAVQMIPGMLIPSEQRGKLYQLEDKLLEKTGIYDEDKKEMMDDLRNGSAGFLEFIPGGIFIVPLFDLLARMYTIEERDEIPQAYQDCTSDTYLPAMMPIELAYVAIAAPIKHFKSIFDKYRSDMGEKSRD